jgi:hypothetical protein
MIAPGRSVIPHPGMISETMILLERRFSRLKQRGPEESNGDLTGPTLPSFASDQERERGCTAEVSPVV